MPDEDPRPGAPARRLQILEAALRTFERYGFRKTSMDDVAAAADISRPGLYLHFPSKQELFRATVLRALEADLAAAQQALADPDVELRDRLLAAFDVWTGRYIGPISADLASLVSDNPELLGSEVESFPGRFAALVEDALVAASLADRETLARDAAATLRSAAIGVKHEATTREEFRLRFVRTVDLVLLALALPEPQRRRHAEDPP